MSETNKTYRNAGFYKFGDGFTIQNNAPIDCRTYVNNITDIYDDANWVGIDVKPYPGMIVSAPSGDVKIYVGKEIKDVTEVTSSTEQIAWRNKENWLDVNIPHFDQSDAGRLLTIVETTNDDQTTSYSAQWVEAPSGLPEITKNEAGKLLTVVETSPGSGVYVAQWVDAPSGLPTINGTSDANKVLQVNANGTGVTWVDAPEELPTIGPGSAGKVLTVSSDGVNTEWSTVDTRFMKNVTTDELFGFVSQRSLKPGMKYRITDYAPAVSTDYSIRINNSVHNIGASTASYVKFDIIVTASSETTLFEDVELVAKDGPKTFDYTKYEVKYDFIGNSREPKYNYILPNARGVIYYMKDQFGNEASYDFENIFYIDPSLPGSILHTFTGGKSGDLRQYGIIQNVRIKNPIQFLPGIIFDFSAYHVNRTGTIIDVELNNCTGIYTTCVSLHHAKISNSNNIIFEIPYDDTITIYPKFDNINICNNDNLTFMGKVDMLRQYNDIGGFYMNNLNILPSFATKTIELGTMASQMVSIFRQGLIDADVLNKFNLTPSNGGWLFAVITDPDSMAPQMLFGQQVLGDIVHLPHDTIVYDAIINASKNVKPFDIFNGLDDLGRVEPWILEIPHFQSTATSVVELGI
jgi:hypothetical protein